MPRNLGTRVCFKISSRYESTACGIIEEVRRNINTGYTYMVRVDGKKTLRMIGEDNIVRMLRPKHQRDLKRRA